VATGIFSSAECQSFIDLLQNPTHIDTSATEDVVRIVERTSLKDATLASFLYERVGPLCPAVWSVKEEDKHMGPFAQGEWALDGIDDRLSLYRYTSGGIFQKHRDGPTYYSVNRRSFFTVLVYLNEEYSGGDTTVFTDDQSSFYKVPHSTGACFVMLQRVLHEGSKVESGLKYALRCDVMYTRSSGSAEECVHHLDPKEQAKKWFDFASRMELSGCHHESVAYYKKAYKLDPEVG
jgi:hypothetical protein